MRKKNLLFLILAASSVNGKSQTASNWIEKLAVNFNLKAWDTIRSLKTDSYGYYNLIEQSETPQGPHIQAQSALSIIKSYSPYAAKVYENTVLYNNKSSTQYLISEKAVVQVSRTRFTESENELKKDELFFAPEILIRKLFDQRAHAHLLKDTFLQGTNHVVIGTTINQYPFKFFINTETGLLTAAEVIRNYGPFGFFEIWGPIKKTVYYSFWNFLSPGVHYPLQQNVYFDRWAFGSQLINNWEINYALSQDSLIIHDTIITTAEAKLKRKIQSWQAVMQKGTKELTKGVWLIPGPCNSTVIEQNDGLVLIEAPLSSEYTNVLLSHINSLFPNKKIKAVVSTSDAWLHIGGLPAVLKRAIPIYYPAKNDFIIHKLLDPVISSKLSGTRKTALIPVLDKMSISDAVHPFTMLPLKTETGERMMMVSLPADSLVYVSDLYQPKRRNGTYWNPHIAWEVLSAIKREKISAERFYAMHIANLIPVTELEKDFQ